MVELLPERTKMIYQYTIRQRLMLQLVILMVLSLGFIVFTLKFVSKDDVQMTGQCRPRQNIVFIKTHKCASSTIQNILMRFGEAHNLTFVLPSTLNYIGHPKLFQRTMVPDATAFNLTYNIFAHHSRFNYQELRLLMPEDTVYVTIVRHPMDLFQSMYYYYGMGKVYPNLLKPSFFVNASTSELLNSRHYNGRIGFNQMSFDLGLDSSDFDRPIIVRKFLSFLDETLDLVMVRERMEESLVLLADLLCWKLEDVVALRLNARHSNYKPRAAWPPETIRALSSLNAADAAVYEHFTRRFRERVRDFGEERMRRQTDELERVKDEKMLLCRFESYIPAKTGVVYYNVRNGRELYCARLVEKELQYTEILRKKQKVLFSKPLLKPN